MSIIYDALKKADKNSYQNKVKVRKFWPKNLVSSEKKVFFVGVAIIITIILFFAYNLIEKENQDKKISDLAAGRQEAEDLRSNLIISEKLAATNFVPRIYRLEGIVFSEAEPFVIINGKIFQEKDMLGNFQISEIEKDSVKLIQLETGKEKILFLDL